MKSNQPEVSKKETSQIISKNKIYEGWKDPVISKLIANWIWYIVPVLATLFFSYFKKEEILSGLKEFIFTDIKLYILIIFLMISLVIRKIYFKYYSKQNKKKEYFLSHKIGNYRFADLNNILLTTPIVLPAYYQKILGIDDLDLLTCFRMFLSRMNMGINWDHPGEEGNFIYYNLGPTLISYDLCKKIPSLNNNTEGNINSYQIQTSQNGLKFFALLESFERINNIKKYQEEILERNNKIAKRFEDK